MDTIPQDTPHKQCTGICKRTLPATTEFFCRKGNGLNAQCKECKSKADKEYRNRPEVHERKLANDAEYRNRPENKERAYEYRRLPYVREQNLTYLRTRYHNDPEFRERTLATNRDYQHTPGYRERRRERYNTDLEYHNRVTSQNKVRYGIPHIREKILNRNKVYRNQPEARERKQANDRAYSTVYRGIPKNQERKRVWSIAYLRNPEVQEHRRIYNKEYRSLPEVRERIRVRALNRIARKKSIPGTYTLAQIQEQLKRQRYRCYYAACGFSKFPRVNGRYVFQIEHTYPISRVHGTGIPANDMSYLVLSCEHCNQSKGSKFPWEWPEGGRLL